MQFILTAEEYETLKAQRQQALTSQRDRLQAICTAAAEHIPVDHDWVPDVKSPWGCILVKGGQNGGGYCDNCPAEFICPHLGKEFSK